MNTKQRNYPEEEVSLTATSVQLKGNLEVPEGARGVVLFAHGSGSSRFSPRNLYVAQVLQQSRLATLLVDLLTPLEEAMDRRTMYLRFDIGLLASRLIDATRWLRQYPATSNLKIGYFGASTGSAAALLAAVEYPDAVSAIVSRGGRPDLVGSALSRVKAPTLLIVGGNDTPIMKLNQQALAQLRTEKQLEIVAGATHLFEEPGTLKQVAQLASQWFDRYLSSVDEQNLLSAR
jgi:putative phosphoribosyl transferase